MENGNWRTETGERRRETENWIIGKEFLNIDKVK